MLSYRPMRPRLLRAIAACAALSAFPGVTGAGRTPVLPALSGVDLSLPILFETAIPLNELPAEGFSERQIREIHYFAERMKNDERIFLLIEASVDPIGNRKENELFAADAAQAVAERLRAAGIRADRMLALKGRVDEGLFDERRWDGFPRRQVVLIRGMQGGPWLVRREVPAAVREELPPEGSIRIAEPPEGRTDRSRHVLRGTTDESVTSVAVALGGETRTAAVYRGAFETPISLRRGENRIVVTGLDRFGRALRAVRTVTYVPPRPSIEITAPEPDAAVDVTRSPVITVRGLIRSRTPLRTAYLIQNDFPRPLRVRADGTFEQRAVLVTESDRFAVEGIDEAGEVGVSEERRVTAAGLAERPLVAVLHWDEDDVDLDLRVADARGRESGFDAPDVMRSASAVPGGRLWFDNRDGYGPEAFSIERAAEGRFTFTARYYRGRKACRAYLTLVLFAGSPSRRLVRTFGPIPLSPARRDAPVVRVALPSGEITELHK